MDGERMNAAGELRRQRLVDHAMTFEAGLSFERRRHDIDAEMGLPARAVPGMAFMPRGFNQHFDAFRRESLGQLFCDQIGGSHVARLGEGGVVVNGCGWLQWKVLNASWAKAHNIRS